MSEQGLPAGIVDSEKEHPAVGTSPTMSKLLDGYRVDHSNHDTLLTFDLKDGKQWKKRIYPRVSYPQRLLRWGTVEEILSFLISFDSQPSWIVPSVPKQPPPSGTVLFYDRSKTKHFRNDGYEWKTRKSQATIVREDRMKLKVGGYQLIYGCYAHSSSNPNLHRRTYWLIQNPNIVMVHYLDGMSTGLTRLSVDQGNLESSGTPSDKNLLTISDCNLCALLDMIDTEMTTQSLFSQLSLILTNNLEQVSSLEEAIKSNNAGLPVDMFQDSRTKKNLTNVSKTDKTTSAQVPRAIDSVDNKVESLYKAPHLVVCRTQNGVMSCFVTIPPPTDSAGAVMFPPGTKLPLPSISQSASYVQKQSHENSQQSRNNLKKKRGGKKVEEKSGENKVCNIFSQMLSFVKPSQPAAPKKVTSEPQPVQLLPPPKVQAKKKDDYDPDQFSKFAHSLANIDNPQSVEEESSPVDNLCNSSSSFSSVASSDTFEDETEMSSVNDAAHSKPIASMPHQSNQDVMEVSGPFQENGEINVIEDPPAHISSSHPSLSNTMQYSNPLQLPPEQANIPSSTIHTDNQLEDLNNLSTDSESFLDMSLDLDDESVQQLLQLSQETIDNPQVERMSTGNGVGTHIESPLSPLSQLMSTFVLPGVNGTPAGTSHTQPGAMSNTTYSGNLGSSPLWMDMPSSDSYNPNTMTKTIPVSSSSVFTEGFPHFSSDTNSFPPPPQSTHPIPSHQPQIATSSHSDSNQPQGTSNMTIIPPELHEIFPRSDIALPVMTTTSAQCHDPSSLYPISTCEPSTSSVDSFLSFPSSMLSSHEYQDLESFMNTVISNPYSGNNQSQDHVPSHPVCLSDYQGTPSTAAQSADVHVHVLDTGSTSSSALSSSSNIQVYGEQGASTSNRQAHHLSLPNLAIPDLDSGSPNFADTSYDMPEPQQMFGGATPHPTLSGGLQSSLSSPGCQSSVSPMTLQDIPEGTQMRLGDIPSMQQLDVFGYRTCSSPISYSPGPASVSSRSSVSVHDLFEGGSPSVFELCEMLSESPNVQQYDFSHLTLSDTEQQQLFRAARTIQSAFRKYKDRRQARCRQKRAALMIEKYYKQYREAKEQDHAARKIQQQYRDYRRSRDLNRAVLFVQQMYRYHRNRKDQDHPKNRQT